MTPISTAGIAVVTLDRQDTLNALTIELIDEVRMGLKDAVTRGAGALVIAGAGRAFCAGADLGVVRSALESGPAPVMGPLIDSLNALMLELRSAPFPTIVAIEGVAVGAGMGLALAADLRVASKSARLVPGYFRIGASPDGGLTYLLIRALGVARTTSLILRNRSINSSEMLAHGLIEEIVEDGEALTAGHALATEVLGSPSLALLQLRRLLDLATVNAFEQQLDAERQSITAIWKTADFREGVTAFLEHRRPSFTGS